MCGHNFESQICTKEQDQPGTYADLLLRVGRFWCEQLQNVSQTACYKCFYAAVLSMYTAMVNSGTGVDLEETS